MALIASNSMEDLRLKKEVWKGALPLCVTLASHDIASLDQPAPLYLMLNRHTYLALCLDRLIEHFGTYTQEGFQRDEIWLSYNGVALKWQYSIGVLADVLCGQQLALPWMLQIHFRAFPADTLIPYQGVKSLRISFISSLKEATALLLGSSQPIMTMAKESEERLWRSICEGDFERYWEVMERCCSPDSSEIKRIPIKAFTSDPHIGLILQPVPCCRLDGALATVGEVVERWLEGAHEVLCQGILLPSETPLLWAWNTLSHPDGFLYLVISAARPPS